LVDVHGAVVEIDVDGAVGVVLDDVVDEAHLDGAVADDPVAVVAAVVPVPVPVPVTITVTALTGLA
jgi:hypothetical protein